AASVGSRNDVGLAVAIHITRRHEHPGVPSWGISEEVVDHLPRSAVVNSDIGATGYSSGGDNVRYAIFVNVAQGNPDSTTIGRAVRIEAQEDGVRIACTYKLDRGLVARVGADGQEPLSLHLEGADVDDAVGHAGRATLVGARWCGKGGIAGVDGWAADEQ